jgi:hypothetical protein
MKGINGEKENMIYLFDFMKVFSQKATEILRIATLQHIRG